VSLLAPAGVVTPMTTGNADLLSRAITVDQLVEKVMASLAEERFLISTHDFVDKLFQLKGQDYEAYMSRMQQRREASDKLNHPPTVSKV
jgi:hypothetical protein